MKQINTISELTHYLRNCSAEELENTCNLINIPLEEYKPYIFWEENNYTRNCIIRTENFELILLCWKNGQESAIHCHNEQECWLYNVSGSFLEERYRFNNGILEKTNELQLSSNNHSYMNDTIGLHKIISNNTAGSISLHLYAKPIDTCTYYNPETKKMETVNLSYYSMEGHKAKSIL